MDAETYLNLGEMTMANTTTLIVTATPNPAEAEAMQAYFKGALPLLMGAGGKLVKRLNIANTIDGEQSFGRVLIMDFESQGSVTKVFASDDYRALIPHRDRGFLNITISLASEM